MMRFVQMVMRYVYQESSRLIVDVKASAPWKENTERLIEHPRPRHRVATWLARVVSIWTIIL